MPERVTIADVARAAGVSYQTVSRAINGKGEISEATRQRVLAAVKALGYRPSSIARGLATNRTLTVGLVVPDIANPFFPEIAKGAEEAARAAGYGLLLCNTSEDAVHEAEVLAALEDKWVDGLILCSSRLDDAGLARHIARQRATVLVNRPIPVVEPGTVVNAICVDDALGMRLAVAHLTARGRRRIGLLAGPPASFSSQARARGYRQALLAEGLPYDPDLCVPCAPALAGGREVAMRLLAAHPDVDALLCYNDLVAVGAVQACAALGRRVPEDVAVVGADDTPLAALVTPPLTTIHVSQHALGVQAATALVRLMRGEVAGQDTIAVQPELVTRGSS